MRHKDRVERITTIDGKQYKLSAVIDKTAEDIHHIISRKKINKFKVNDAKNKVKINRRKHIALNALYGDHQTPKEQLKDMVDIWKTALSEEVRTALYDILALDDEAFYDYDLVKKHKLLKDNIW